MPIKHSAYQMTEIKYEHYLSVPYIFKQNAFYK